MKDKTSWSCSCSSLKLCLLSVLVLTETVVAIKLPPNLKIPALIAFGDSIVDTGNNNYVKTVVKCDFHPYGINFQGGVPTGRFCDGRVPVDLLAEEVGIKSVVPAYLDPNVKSEDLLTGVSFASGGSGYDPITPKLVAVISLEDQLKYFEEYIEKVKNLVGEERKEFILANSLILLVAGSDDIANTYYDLRARPQYDVDSYTTLMANSASDFVTKLYGYGVRRIAVFGAPPLGCVPSQRTLGGGLMRDCAEYYNEAAKLFNSKLSTKLDLLHKTLPGIRSVYINIYDPLLDIIQKPAKYGFGVSNKGCCGTGVIEVAVLCNKITSSVCPDVSSHVFWDSYHPTEKTYKVLVSLLISKFVKKSGKNMNIMLDMDCRKNILVLALFYIYLLATPAASKSFPALLAFGDSIVDTGNNNYLLTLMKGNYWPYGRSFDMRVPTGRFGNGRVFSDIIADGLGIKKTLPAYRKLFIAPNDLKTGVCFASGGAGVDPVTSRMLRVLSPQDQVKDFKGYIRKLKTVAPTSANNIIANAVYLISEGNNDIGITFFGTPSATFRGMTPNRYTTKLVGWNKQFMKDLYNQGARKFAVMGVIPLGCLPMSRIFLGGFVVWCNFFANRVAQDYNRKLKNGIKSWGSESGFRGAKFVYVDMYNTLMDVINNHRKYGFTNEKNGCCCMITAMIPCPNPDRYVFYDFAHPSEKAYKTISKKLVQDIKTGLA
ncbi:unnamed protein product [Thlaspi arvense]|uniref:Uncharacterized protein n=1 Tax=Thlaspi arvense TaxID=13288 RepID=A0AAU9SJ76_THLAR|nr:unnamed protein product [Thlaspi arvense]